MTRRILIADAGPLIALASVESLYLLHRLFGGLYPHQAGCKLRSDVKVWCKRHILGSTKVVYSSVKLPINFR